MNDTESIDLKIRHRLKCNFERGRDLLDNKYINWRDKINNDTLNLAVCETCIIGQLYGDYLKGIESLDINNRTEQEEYGFDCILGEDTGDWSYTMQYEYLEYWWKKELENKNG